MVNSISGSGSVYPSSSDSNNYTDFKTAVHHFLSSPTQANLTAVENDAKKLKSPPSAIQDIVSNCKNILDLESQVKELNQQLKTCTDPREKISLQLSIDRDNSAIQGSQMNIEMDLSQLS